MAWTPQTRLWRRRFATGRRPLAVRAAPSRPDDVTVRREQDHSWQLQALISTVAPKLTDAGRHSEQPPYERLSLLGKQPDLVAIAWRATECWATRAGDGLHVEDLFDSVIELKRRDRGPGADVDDPEPALELLGVRRDRHPTEDDALTDPRQPDEGEIVVKGQAAGVSRKYRDILAVSGGRINPFQPTHAGVQDEQVPVVPARRMRHRESGRHHLA